MICQTLMLKYAGNFADKYKKGDEIDNKLNFVVTLKPIFKGTLYLGKIGKKGGSGPFQKNLSTP